jgi:hypothetical protein
MSEDDKNKLNTLENALYLVSDVLDLLVMDVNSVLKNYTNYKMNEYDKLRELSKEARRCVCTFDKLMNDDKACAIFSSCSDNLYKMIYNKASSYINKLKKYEESVNKKAARVSKVA